HQGVFHSRDTSGGSTAGGSGAGVRVTHLPVARARSAKRMALWMAAPPGSADNRPATGCERGRP
ncbi:hypothetical protein, partial [Nocardia wallacei]|uniref:hypothetical protein n=1 Tax=Nocardia wallacei TaxID=480035 RepID=UPI002458F8CB